MAMPPDGMGSRSGSALGRLAGPVGAVQRGIRRLIVPFGAVALAVPRGGRLLEIGCGEGLVIERVLAKAEEIWGVDRDARKIDAARARLAAATHVRLECADAFAFLAAEPAGAFDTVLLVDTLSAFAVADQKRLLQAAIAALRPGGTLIVKAIDAAPRWKAALSRAVSGAVFRGLRMSLSENQRFTYLPCGELRAILEETGAVVTIRQLHREHCHPIPHVLVVARVSAAGDGSCP
jgi:2-polyprenyl-3-methyl-5-hydroxy-6-metoxy-1,4-benzoquinol methylase